MSFALNVYISIAKLFNVAFVKAITSYAKISQYTF